MAVINIRFYALSLYQTTECVVLMPDGLKEGEKVKVLYLLHGHSDDCSMWTRRTSLERYLGYNGRLAVVMPSAQISWYSDSALGNFFTYITDDLPKLIKSYFPQISDRREDTFIAGLSMGGYGAMKAALTYPQKYAFCASLSAAFDMQKRIATHGSCKMLYGSEEQFKGGKDDLFAIADRAVGKDLPKLYIACGEQDECCLDDNKKFPQYLKQLGIDYEMIWDDGCHSWEYWDRHIKVVIDKINNM